MRKRLSILTKAEKILVAFLSLAVLITGSQITHAFYIEHSSITPVEGGIYIEGAVGKVGVLNPLYVQYGTVTHDLTQLIFSGLSKFDPATREIVGDLADFTISEDATEYTFVIKENARWHDGTPVTAEDVLFTYSTVINNPSFSGQILNYNDYSGMKLSIIDDRTVQFLLDEPDSFFLVKTTSGLLPEHALGHLPVEMLEQAPFNQFPIGTGPYQFVSMLPIDNAIEVTLEAYRDYYGEAQKIPTIQMKLFESYKELVKKQGELDGLRNVPREYADKILKRGRLNLIRYQLPQYVAVFINTQSDKLKDRNVRLGLQLGINKNSLIKAIGQNEIIDTPLLEIDQNNWVYQYSVKKANGALFETEWQLPNLEGEPEAETEDEEEADEEEVLDPDDTSKVTYINNPNGGHDWETTDTKITLTGTVPEKTKAVIINDYELSKFVPGDPGWSYVASFKFENLKRGKNIYEVYVIGFDEEKTLVDAITIHQGTPDEFRRIDLEKRKKENQVADDLPLRTNAAGDKMVLKLIAPSQPEAYSQVAELVKDQWRKIGVGITIDILENGAFQESLYNRDYDLLIFGQNLGYNLDAYPYWHSSQAKEGGFNLSQFKNFVVDSLLEKARLELDSEDRRKTLSDIQTIIAKEVPAIFLYSPNYYFALSEKIQNASFENLATISDRFADIEQWYARVDRRLNEGVNPLTFASWILNQF